MKLESDPVAYFLDQCFAAGIKDPVRFLISKMPQTYGWLKGAFPRGIIPTDIDGLVECNGQFLMLEFKHGEALRSGRIPKGQHMMLTRLVETGCFTVFMVGLDDRGLPSLVQVLVKGRPAQITDPIDFGGLCEKCSKWSAWAEKKPRFLDTK